LPAVVCRLPAVRRWLHEIKHDGYRLMARRDPVGIRLITRRGNDWSSRFPLVVAAVNHLKVRSCLIHGEVVFCDEHGLARFDVLRRRRNEVDACLYAFDLLELDGTDLRREPIETRKATLASVLRKCRPGLRLNEHLGTSGGRRRVPARLRARLRGHLVQAARLALSLRPLAGLAQVQEPGCTCGAA
jgi:bifunctional non-homologous end joining protein LigD